MLQKPHKKSKDKDHKVFLGNRLKLLEQVEFTALLQECNTIQTQLHKYHVKKKKVSPSLPCDFSKLMFQGKVERAIRLLSDKEEKGLLGLSDIITDETQSKSVWDILKEKHPPAQMINHDSIVPPLESMEVHPVFFEQIDASLIRKTVLRCKGAAGPSGLDASAWRRLCTSFGVVSDSLCCSLALSAIRLCTELVDPSLISPLLASRLIAINKCPGVRPIGIGDTSRRIIAKAVLSILRPEIQDVAGLYQLCAGQSAGVESAAHAVRDLFQNPATEAVIFVDAKNAFNSLNRFSALHNIRSLCPPFANILINCYRDPSALFIENEVLHSKEGTTQGDPLAMPFYALATIPLIKKMPDSVTQIWYADDASASGSLHHLRHWWKSLVEFGPKFGYFVNPKKTWVLTKEQHLANATSLFKDLSINITCSGRPYLGIPIGTQEYVNDFVQAKVDQWVSDIEQLSLIAHSQPHAAFAVLNHGLTSKWLYFFRTIPLLSGQLTHLESKIRSHLLPALTGKSAPNDSERDLMALPVRSGGLGIRDPTKQAEVEFSASVQICSPMVKNMLSGLFDNDYDCVSDQLLARSDVRKEKLAREKSRLEVLMSSLLPTKQRILKLAGEKGASIWLSSLPLYEYGFSLHKRAFIDALALRYGWSPLNTPIHCGCGAVFSVEHSLSCAKGGFPTIRHNELRNLTASLLTEVCHDVQIEPHLQPTSREECPSFSTNIQDGARLDV